MALAPRVLGRVAQHPCRLFNRQQRLVRSDLAGDRHIGEDLRELGEQIADDLPYNDYYEYYGPDYKLHITPSNMENLNLPDNLEKIKAKIFDNLRQIVPAPNVQMHQTAPDAGADDDGADDDADPDSRGGQGGADKKVDPTATV